MAWETITIGECQLICADCADVLPSLTGISTVFTSPPYNLGGAPWPHLSHFLPRRPSGGHGKWKGCGDASTGVKYALHDDCLPHATYVEWQQHILRLCWQSLANDGVIFYNHKPRVIGCEAWLPLELNPGLPLRQIITWARAGGINFNRTAYMPTYEWIMVLAKPDWRLKSKAVSGIGDVWSIPQQANPDHPAPFPLALPMRALETLWPGVVCDPFMGSGTVGVACAILGLPFVGIDIEQRNVDLACKAIDRAYAQGDMYRPKTTQPPQQLSFA